MQELKIKKMPTELDMKGYRYTLVERGEKKAIYAQCRPDTNEILSYEVFLIRVTTPSPFTGSSGTHYDREEKYPRFEDFGKKLWSFLSLEEAHKKYDSL